MQEHKLTVGPSVWAMHQCGRQHHASMSVVVETWRKCQSAGLVVGTQGFERGMHMGLQGLEVGVVPHGWAQQQGTAAGSPMVAHVMKALSTRC